MMSVMGTFGFYSTSTRRDLAAKRVHWWVCFYDEKGNTRHRRSRRLRRAQRLWKAARK